MNKSTGFILSVVLLVLLALTACGKDKPKEDIPDVKILTADLEANLQTMDTAIGDQILALQGVALDEKNLRACLAEIMASHPAIKTAFFIDDQGAVKYTEPELYKHLEGKSLMDQEHVAAMLKNPAPVLSAPFTTVEGYTSIILAQPLFELDQRFSGSFSISIDTTLLPRLVLDKAQLSDEYELFAMDTDGTIVCDQDSIEIGKNTFSDPMYQDFTSLQSLAKQVVANPSGEGKYSFKAAGANKVVDKTATWETISLHGREWRVMLMHR